MSHIRKFFNRKKEEAKFKLKLGNIGQGHQLNAPSSSSTSQSSRSLPEDAYIPPRRDELSVEARTAAAAAMARVAQKNRNVSLTAIRAQAKRELEAEAKQKALRNESPVRGNGKEQVQNLACSGVYFRCPMIGEEVLSSKEWKIKIKEFLYQQLESDRALTACLIIYNCNVKEKTEECVATLSKYIENIINHPEDEKYLKIRMSNRIFCEKVRYVEGALDFLYGSGFREQEIDNETFLLWSRDNMDPDVELQTLLDALHNAEKIQLELDRNIQVLLPTQARSCELPPEFFRIPLEELKREQQLRTEAIENAQVLRTKAMRERDELRNLRAYKFTLIRVRFPSGIYLQGTFNVYEKLSDIYEFVQSCLVDEFMQFNLTYCECKFSDDDMNKSLFELRLVPNVLLFFNGPLHSSSDSNFLKEELLMLVQSM